MLLHPNKAGIKIPQLSQVLSDHAAPHCGALCAQPPSPPAPLPCPGEMQRCCQKWNGKEYSVLLSRAGLSSGALL